MSISKPGLPKGTRDFGPEKMVRRNFIFDHIKKVFQKYGFLPLETPAMENLDVLTGKYGDEGDQLIFKILNSGNFLEKITPVEIEKGYKKVTPEIAEKALRYDLTVPFARYVVMNRNDIQFPFKRYQMQPVWRADRPQKGRYREFYQCDADVVGTNSLVCEAEIVLMISEVLEALGIQGYVIKINNRKVLEGVAELYDLKDHLIEMTVAIDKLDKIGAGGVVKELMDRGIDSEKAGEVVAYFTGYAAEGKTNENKLEYLTRHFQEKDCFTGLKGIEEVKEVLHLLGPMQATNLDFDISLARGLSYYTGAIFEVKALDVQIGSISGGGRYDNLTGVFGLPNTSGVGISFGVDRIYDVMEELSLFPDATFRQTKVMYCCFDKEGILPGFTLIQKLRKRGVSAEVYPDPGKLKKPLDYANKKNIPFVIIAGEDELKSGYFTLKDMLKGEQYRLNEEELINKLSI